MTRREKQIARHALGLPNPLNASVRNQFRCNLMSSEFDVLRRMEAKGMAESMPVTRLSRTVRFWLTPSGAMGALEDSERLCPKEFPEAI